MNGKTVSITENGFRARRKRERMILFLLMIFWFVISAFLLIYGDQIYTLSTVLQVLEGKDIKGASYAVNTIRLPKVLIGTFSGFAFGAAGSTFQKILRNPLASPDVMGVTAGASAAAVSALMLLNLEGALVSAFAAGGGMLTAFIILQVSRSHANSIQKMILTGIGMQAMLQAVINFVVLKTSDYDIGSALQWLSGSLNGTRMKDVPVFAVIVIVCAALLLYLDRDIQLLGLGEELPVTLGIDPVRIRGLLIFIGVILCAGATAVTGPLASVAFMAGPISVRLLKTGGTNTIHAGLIGALIVLASEAAGQFAFSVRYPVGVITGIIGAPYLIYMLIRMNHKSA